MSFLNGVGVGGGMPHSDVLSVDPSALSPSEKSSLLEELRRRGRAAVGSKQYRDAELLYDKAIDMTDDSANKELSVLYANRSLVRLQMNRLEASRSDAFQATKYDATHIKAFWRLGQVCMAMRLFAEAADAYQTAISLDSGGGSSNALIKEAERAKQALIEEEASAEHQPHTHDNLFTSSHATQAPSNGTSSEDDVQTVTNADSEFSKSDHVRGYKLVGNKKTSYFHHEMTEHEMRLIGDIAPKRIIDHTTNEQQTNDGITNTTSAWNKAGTWEERDVTSWAVDTLTATLLGCSYTSNDHQPVKARVVKIDKPSHNAKDGHASFATVRGKKRYIYEFAISLSWEMLVPSCEGEEEREEIVYTGTMTFPEVDGTVVGGYDVGDFTIHSSSPNGGEVLCNKFVRNGGLRTVVERGIDSWVDLFRATF